MAKWPKLQNNAFFLIGLTLLHSDCEKSCIQAYISLWIYYLAILTSSPPPGRRVNNTINYLYSSRLLTIYLFGCDMKYRDLIISLTGPNIKAINKVKAKVCRCQVDMLVEVARLDLWDTPQTGRAWETQTKTLLSLYCFCQINCEVSSYDNVLGGDVRSWFVARGYYKFWFCFEKNWPHIFFLWLVCFVFVFREFWVFVNLLVTIPL